MILRGYDSIVVVEKEENWKVWVLWKLMYSILVIIVSILYFFNIDILL